MENQPWYESGPFRERPPTDRPAVVLDVVSDPSSDDVWIQAAPRRRRFWLPLFLFLATCLSTIIAGGFGEGYVYWQIAQQTAAGLLDPTITVPWHFGLRGAILAGILYGLKYAVPVMTILLCHEMGHFLQAWRYGVHASFPYFIPMPISPFGTFGAVIAMESHRGDRRALFDIGISGPLAGLIPTFIFLFIGLGWSHVDVVRDFLPHYGDPLLLQWICRWYFGPIPPGCDVYLHPMAFAAWVGLFITSLNLLPIGQLDGGHVLYALLRRKAYWISRFLLISATLIVGIFQYWFPELRGWILLLVLLVFVVGPIHPPTADDEMPLGFVRSVLGWLVLAFIPLGFTPMPISFGP